MRFGLKEKYIDFILEVLNHNLKNTNYYIFGSRASGKYAEYSDIDIALENEDIIDSKIMTRLKSEFENSTLPYEVDIIDLNSISDSFKSCIEGSLLKL